MTTRKTPTPTPAPRPRGLQSIRPSVYAQIVKIIRELTPRVA